MSVRSSSASVTRFVNVDLELVGTAELDPLLSCLSAATLVLRDSNDAGRRTVWLELEGETPDVDATLVHFMELVAGLPPEIRVLWDRCEDRCFNVGVQAGVTPRDAAFRVESRTLARLADVSARLEFTVYAIGRD